jgi:phytanoyl-CoA hydroxylase
MEAMDIDAVYGDEPLPLDEGAWLDLDASTAAKLADDLPLSTRFHLRSAITPVQQAFLAQHGFLVFARVLAPAEVELVLSEMDRVQAELIETGAKRVYSVPVWFGTGPDGEPWLQRMGFTSVLSPAIGELVRDARFEPVRTLIGEDARIGDREKDGVVYNCYVNAPGSLRPGLGWHTDALRDVFYNWRPPGPMLNVGLHYDRIRPEDGGLRLLPGTHTQSVTSTLLRKIHFVSKAADKDEIPVETWPGDLTVHDGRMWHRVEPSPHTGVRSRRRSMYIPYVCDAYQPKDEQSKPLLYQRIFDRYLTVKRWWLAR